MSTKRKYEELFKEISADYHALLESENRDIATTSKYISKAYAFICDNCSNDSPLLRIANGVIDSDINPWQKAQALHGVLSELESACEKSGYFKPIDEIEHYKSYEKFSSAVRNWLIAYGIAGPAILIAEENVLIKIVESKYTLLIGILFLGGVLLQVLRSILYKATSWFAMDYKYFPEDKATTKMKFSLWINNNMFIDLVVDMVAIVMFILATIFTLIVIGTNN
jgi:hypothetical protein